MAATGARPTFEDAALQTQVKRLRQVDNHTNFVYLAIDYLCLLVVIGGTVVFAEIARNGVSRGRGTFLFSSRRLF